MAFSMGFTKVIAAAGVADFPYFTVVYVVGFIAAVTIGSLAWYNSKRPAGWEDKNRPDFLPNLSDSDTPSDSE